MFRLSPRMLSIVFIWLTVSLLGCGVSDRPREPVSSARRDASEVVSSDIVTQTPTPSQDEPFNTTLQFLAALQGPDHDVVESYIAGPNRGLVTILAVILWRVQQTNDTATPEAQAQEEALICREPFERFEIVGVIDAAPSIKRVVVRTYHGDRVGGVELEFERQNDQWHIVDITYLSEGDEQLK